MRQRGEFPIWQDDIDSSFHKVNEPPYQHQYQYQGDVYKETHSCGPEGGDNNTQPATELFARSAFGAPSFILPKCGNGNYNDFVERKKEFFDKKQGSRCPGVGRVQVSNVPPYCYLFNSWDDYLDQCVAEPDCSLSYTESLETPFKKLHRLNTCIHERRVANLKKRTTPPSEDDIIHDNIITAMKDQRERCVNKIKEKLKDEHDNEIRKRPCSIEEKENLYLSRKNTDCLVLIPYKSSRQKKHFKYWVNTCYYNWDTDSKRNNLFADYPHHVNEEEWNEYWGSEDYLKRLYDLFMEITPLDKKQHLIEYMHEVLSNVPKGTVSLKSLDDSWMLITSIPENDDFQEL